MNYKKKIIIICSFIIITIQILLLINNNQKSSLKFFVWKINDISIGKLICISFISGLTISSILSTGLNNNNKEKIDNKNDFFINNEDNINNSEIPPQRDVREPQPTISVNYRVIKNNGEKELDYMDRDSNKKRYEDDWNNNDSDW